MSPAGLGEALAAYDSTALAALASKGLVRRAERDLTEGSARVSGFEGDCAVVSADGETVRIDLAGPAAARCTCPARGVCRHVLVATLLLSRDAGGTATGTAEASAVPATAEAATARTTADAVAPSAALDEILALAEDELAAWAGRTGMREAAALLAANPAPEIRVEAATLAVRLGPERPDVVWLAGHGLAGIVSKAPAAKRKGLHAAALLAVRRAHGLAPPDVPGAEAPEPEAPPDAGFLDEVTAALFAYLRAGFGAAPLALETRLGGLALSSRASALPRLAALLRTLAARLREKRERSATAEPFATLALLGETFALATALRAAGEPAEPGAGNSERLANLRGRVRESFESIGQLHLFGIGATAWETRTGARGVTGYFYAPERARWFTASLARPGGSDLSFRSAHAYRSEAVWGTQSLEDLVHGEVRVEGAAASGDGRLSFGKTVRARCTPFAGVARTLEAWPVTYSRWDALEGGLRRAAAPTLAGPRLARHVVLLRPRLAADPYEDPFTQRLIWPLADEAGRWLALAVPDGAERGGLASALAQLADLSRIACVAALAQRAGPAFALQPFAVLRGEGAAERFESLGLDVSAAPDDGSAFFSKLAKRASQALRGGPPQFAPAAGAGTALARALGEASEALVSIAELGGLDVAPEHARRLAERGRTLRDLGFEAVGAAAERAAASVSGDHAAVLTAVYLISRAEALTVRIPELVRHG